jgi:hypothetical protein
MTRNIGVRFGETNDEAVRAWEDEVPVRDGEFIQISFVSRSYSVSLLHSVRKLDFLPFLCSNLFYLSFLLVDHG